MKILSIVGARPQFIKAAVISRRIRAVHTEVLVHTGQHYDYNMSDVFFEELDIPKPDYNLGISGGTHGEMTGKMLISLEAVMRKENPELVLLYGDTNSTLAGAVAASKLFIPICHIEAGVREAGIKNGTFTNPEEINRVITDRVSTYLMCCTKADLECLQKENMGDNAYFVGDLMYDAFKYYSEKSSLLPVEVLIGLDGESFEVPSKFYYLTCHREENTRTDDALLEIMLAMNELEIKTIYPVHPRNQKRAKLLKEKHLLNNLILCQPVGYLMSLYLVKNAKKVVTDSGGLQREAFFAETQCITIADDVAWIDTMTGKRNQLSKPNKEEILEKLSVEQLIGQDEHPFGNGDAAEKIIKIISKINF